LEVQERRYAAIVPAARRVETDRLQLRNKLHKLIEEAFDLEELRDIAFATGVEFDDLPAKTKSGKIRELILHFMGANEMWRLMMILQQERPSVDWPDAELVIGDGGSDVSDEEAEVEVEAED
jgi:hypothetical protein